MAKLGLAIIFTLLVQFGHSQQPGYVVLIDADKEQIFHVRIGDTIYASSSLGHLTIPHLKDSTYRLAIGFPRSQSSEIVFSVRVNKKDLGFQLKNEDGKGWVLYNWQTRDTKLPVRDPDSKPVFEERGVKRDDAFTRLMAAVVNDTSVMYNAFVAEKVNLDSTKKLAANKDSAQNLNPRKGKPAAAVTAAATVPTKKQKNAKKNEVKEAIQKIDEVATSAGLKMTYMSTLKDGKTDTVALIIPVEKENEAAVIQKDTTLVVAQQPTKKKRKRQKNAADSVVNVTPANPTADTGARVQLPECKSVASDYDLDVLRMSILTANHQEDKIAVAGKTFKTKCFTVKQLRTLLELFSNDKTRYAFLQTAYPFTSDRNNFGQLADMLTDKEYASRFHQDFP
ncbi:MAG: hypothetical protein C5B59_09705 [Bacteroidetes bacterium]|nr:MAG: hypothetical protein C5B59_09705 [Bacteroidota bacterium]